MKHRMQRNLILLFLCSSAVPLIVVAGVGYLSSTRSIVGMMREQTGFSCLEIEQRFELELLKIRDQFVLAARGAGALPGVWESRVRRRNGEVEFFVEDLVATSLVDRIFTDFIFLGPDGEPRYKINYQSFPIQREHSPEYYMQTTGFRPEDRRGFEEASRLARHELELLHPEPTSATLIARFVTPMFSEGERLGTMIADFDVGNLLEGLVDGVSLGKDAFWFLLDSRSQVVLSHPDYAKRNQVLAVAMPYLADSRVGSATSGSQRFRGEDGRNWLFSFRRLPDAPWVIAVAGPLDTFLSPIVRVGGLNLLLVALVLSGTTVLIVFATRRFRHSLTSLTGAAESFSSGQLDRRVAVRSDDEMGALGSTFNRMAEQLEKQIEEREQNARFESFNRLSAVLAHDLKSSLFSLSLLVENLERNRGDPEFLHDSAVTIRNTLDKMEKTTEKLSAGRSVARSEKVPLDLAPLLATVLEASGVRSHSGIRVDTELQPDARCAGDPSEIERLFMNLLLNAAEAMPDGGTLRLACRRLPQDGAGPAWVEVVVEDTGVGMEPEFVRDKLFRPFSSTKEKGIGLGLYSAKEIVDHHGGRMDVDSRPGSGTRFVVLLPEPAPGEA